MSNCYNDYMEYNNINKANVQGIFNNKIVEYMYDLTIHFSLFAVIYTQ